MTQYIDRYQDMVHYKFFVPVSPSSTPKGEIGSGYPSNVYDRNRLSLPIQRQKQAHVLCCDVY
jgi:hypothetical protein